MTEQPELFPPEPHWRNKTFTRNDAPETSIQAAKQALPRSGDKKAKVYQFIVSRGSQGATDDEIYRALPEINVNTIRPRRVDLFNEGLIIKSGHRETIGGSIAIVWIAAQHTV